MNGKINKTSNSNCTDDKVTSPSIKQFKSNKSVGSDELEEKLFNTGPVRLTVEMVGAFMIIRIWEQKELLEMSGRWVSFTHDI